MCPMVFDADLKSYGRAKSSQYSLYERLLITPGIPGNGELLRAIRPIDPFQGPFLEIRVKGIVPQTQQPVR